MTRYRQVTSGHSVRRCTPRSRAGRRSARAPTIRWPCWPESSPTRCPQPSTPGRCVRSSRRCSAATRLDAHAQARSDPGSPRRPRRSANAPARSNRRPNATPKEPSCASARLIPSISRARRTRRSRARRTRRSRAAVPAAAIRAADVCAAAPATPTAPPRRRNAVATPLCSSAAWWPPSSSSLQPS